MATKNRRVTMWDSVDPNEVPEHAEAVAGYVDGAWPSWFQFSRDGTHRWIIGIATSPESNAHVLDVEAGDATPGEAALWVRWQHSLGVKRPAVYCSLSAVPLLKAELLAKGLPRRAYRLWTAHWTGHPHMCNRLCERGFGLSAGATQYKSLISPNVDVSLTTVQWLNGLTASARGRFGPR